MKLITRQNKFDELLGVKQELNPYKSRFFVIFQKSIFQPCWV